MNDLGRGARVARVGRHPGLGARRRTCPPRIADRYDDLRLELSEVPQPRPLERLAARPSVREHARLADAVVNDSDADGRAERAKLTEPFSRSRGVEVKSRGPICSPTESEMPRLASPYCD
jgi:hypothetical protein